MKNINTSRHGTILIIVAGISSLLAAMALTFLVRMRSDVQESLHTVREAQAHIMKVAACNFVMETARLGWDPNPPSGVRLNIRRESFGWVDVRDGKPGPRGADELGGVDYKRLGPVDNSGVPVRGTDGKPKWDKWVNLDLPDNERPAKRCPMYVMMRPPFAVSPRVVVNPIATTGPEKFLPYAAKPDPQRFKPDMTQMEYIEGDKRTDVARYVPSWFRVWRASPATFVVTCGVGDTHGFRSWKEVQDAGQGELFGGDNPAGESLFYLYQSQEIRLWYLIEWSAHVASSDYRHFQNEYNIQTIDSYIQRPINLSNESRSQGKQVNSVGTISFIQRLVKEPNHW